MSTQRPSVKSLERLRAHELLLCCRERSRAAVVRAVSSQDPRHHGKGSVNPAVAHVIVLAASRRGAAAMVGAHPAAMLMHTGVETEPVAKRKLQQRHDPGMVEQIAEWFAPVQDPGHSGAPRRRAEADLLVWRRHPGARRKPFSSSIGPAGTSGITMYPPGRTGSRALQIVATVQPLCGRATGVNAGGRGRQEFCAATADLLRWLRRMIAPGLAAPQRALHSFHQHCPLVTDATATRCGNAASRWVGGCRGSDGRGLLPVADLRAVADVDAHRSASVSEPFLDQPRYPRFEHPDHGPRPRRGRLSAGADRAPALDGAGPAARLRGAAGGRSQPQLRGRGPVPEPRVLDGTAARITRSLRGSGAASATRCTMKSHRHRLRSAAAGDRGAPIRTASRSA